MRHTKPHSGIRQHHQLHSTLVMWRYCPVWQHVLEQQQHANQTLAVQGRHNPGSCNNGRLRHAPQQSQYCTHVPRYTKTAHTCRLIKHMHIGEAHGCSSTLYSSAAASSRTQSLTARLGYLVCRCCAQLPLERPTTAAACPSHRYHSAALCLPFCSIICLVHLRQVALQGLLAAHTLLGIRVRLPLLHLVRGSGQIDRQ